MTSLTPRKPYTDEELWQLYPEGLQLQLVQVLMRHGERTPVSPRFQNAGLQPFWPYCSAMRRFRSAVLLDEEDLGAVGGGAATKAMGAFAWKRRLETFAEADDAAVPATGPKGQLDALCDMGMLTDPGRASTLRLGRRLRSLYVDRLGFLPATVRDAEDVGRQFLLRATPVPRALESMQQAFSGMYPETVRGDFPPVTVVSREIADETLFPNDGHCRRFAELARAFAERAAVRWNDSEELAHVTRKIGRWMPADSPRVAVGGKPRLSGIMDTVNATLAHGPETRLPAEFYDAGVRRNLERVALEEWFAGFHASQEYRALGIGSLAGDLVARMVQHAEADRSPLKFALAGCHDTTLAALLTSLGVQLTDWPPFTSHVALELFQGPPASPAPAPKTGWFSSLTKPAAIGRRPTPELTDAQKHKLDGYYVRIRYNDEPVTFPGCRLPGNHLQGDESFCTLAAFKDIVDKYTPRDWKSQCRSNRGVPVPDKAEIAGY